MRSKWILRLAYPAMLALACCSVQKGDTIYSAGPGVNKPTLGTASESGVYSLYVGDTGNPEKIMNLKKGDPLGFRKNDNGEIIAVGGESEIDLGVLSTQAHWNLEPKQ